MSYRKTWYQSTHTSIYITYVYLTPLNPFAIHFGWQRYVYAWVDVGRTTLNANMPTQCIIKQTQQGSLAHSIEKIECGYVVNKPFFVVCLCSYLSSSLIFAPFTLTIFLHTRSLVSFPSLARVFIFSQQSTSKYTVNLEGSRQGTKIFSFVATSTAYV